MSNAATSEPLARVTVASRPASRPASSPLAGLIGVAVVTLTCVPVGAQSPPETVYAPPPLYERGEGRNEGAITLELDAAYFNDYLFRGLRNFPRPQDPDGSGPAERVNVRAAGRIDVDLGRAPAPFLAVLAHGAEGDDLSTLQEIRGTAGLRWVARPIELTLGHTTYLYPERRGRDTNEAFASLTLDDSPIWRTDRPVLSPFVTAAYDYDLYDGWYVEAGVRHTMTPFEGAGLTLTAEALVAYVNGIGRYVLSPDGPDEGVPFYQLGLHGRYEMNRLLNIPARYGRWSLTGHLFYTDGIDADLASDTALWGGAGLQLRY